MKQEKSSLDDRKRERERESKKVSTKMTNTGVCHLGETGVLCDPAVNPKGCSYSDFLLIGRTLVCSF